MIDEKIAETLRQDAKVAAKYIKSKLGLDYGNRFTATNTRAQSSYTGGYGIDLGAFENSSANVALWVDHALGENDPTYWVGLYSIDKKEILNTMNY